ncbi:type II secretion system F family protein [Streptomyces sp. NPDC057694]|uniref:type II secretion system F family protein n=1 Tax=Streptomyces sp. NPDC057694 TaxID=3346216 RepID=UPI0036C8D7C5
MSSSYLSAIGMVAGLLVVLGLAGLVAWWRGWTPGSTRRRGTPALRDKARQAVGELPAVWRDNYRLLLVAAAVVGVIMWVLTGWPVQALLAAAAIAGLPFVLYPGGSERLEVARLEALAEWLGQLASVRSSGKSLETAIVTLTHVPALLHRPVAVLCERLASGMPARHAYRLFADDLDSRIGDDIAQLFMDHVISRGAGLSEALSAQAALVRRQAAEVEDIDARRADARAETRKVSLFVLAVVAFVLVNGAYWAPLANALGQLALLGMGALFVLLLWWMRKVAAMKPEPRTLLAAKERRTPEVQP